MPFLLLSEEGEAALLECLDHGDMLVHAAVEVYHEEHDDHDFQDTLRRVAQRAVSVGAVTQPLTKKASETDMPAGLALDEEEDGADEDHVAFEGRDVITSVRAWLRVVGVRGLLGGVDDTLPCCAHTHTVARPARCGRRLDAKPAQHRVAEVRQPPPQGVRGGRCRGVLGGQRQERAAGHVEAPPVSSLVARVW